MGTIQRTWDEIHFCNTCFNGSITGRLGAIRPCRTSFREMLPASVQVFLIPSPTNSTNQQAINHREKKKLVKSAGVELRRNFNLHKKKGLCSTPLCECRILPPRLQHNGIIHIYHDGAASSDDPFKFNPRIFVHWQPGMLIDQHNIKDIVSTRKSRNIFQEFDEWISARTTTEFILAVCRPRSSFFVLLLHVCTSFEEEDSHSVTTRKAQWMLPSKPVRNHDWCVRMFRRCCC